MPDARIVDHRRQEAQNALMDYAEALKVWNAPDDEHTRLTLRSIIEDVISEVLPK